MTFRDRFKMYLLGFIAGCFLVILFFGRKNSCKNYLTNYLPEGRVLLEVGAKPIFYSEQAAQQLQNLGIDTADFRKEILPQLHIDFDRSEPRAIPCGNYISSYNDSIGPLQIKFEKCKENSRIQEISIQ
ncbi:MAG: hypothetical protein Q4G27_09745 [Flavobacteriaceae bacterium]|nr:hypothetical protein [Flavobacteriaceae bacterium]